MNNPKLIFNEHDFPPPKDNQEYHEWFQNVWGQWVDNTVSKIIGVKRSIWRASFSWIHVTNFNLIPYRNARQVLIKYGQPLRLIKVLHSLSFKEIWQLSDRAYTPEIRDLGPSPGTTWCIISKISYDDRGTIIVEIA